MYEVGRKTDILFIAMLMLIIGIMGLMIFTFLENHFGLSFGKANRLQYGLMLLAVVATVVGGYFLLKKPEGSYSYTPPNERLMNVAYELHHMICNAYKVGNLNSTPELKNYAQGQGQCTEFFKAANNCDNNVCTKKGANYNTCMMKCIYTNAPIFDIRMKPIKNAYIPYQN